MRRLTALLVSLCTISACADEAPKEIDTFVREFCASCHGAKSQKGDFRFDHLTWQLSETESRGQWELVRDYIADGDMPPKKAKKQPTDSDRKSILATLNVAFEKADRASVAGGTPLRRLNRIEYLNTVRDLFGIRMIKLPPSFPEDATSLEFDTMPDGLFLSPAVMDAYHDVATVIADRVAPLPNPATYQSSLDTETIGGDATRRWFGPKNAKQYLKFTGFNQSGWVGALWDSGFVAPSSGVYRVKLLANAQAEVGADGKPLRLSFHAFDPTEEVLPKRFRIERASLVAEIDVPPGEPTWIQCDVPVEAGEAFHVYCTNRFSAGVYPKGDLNRSEINRELKKLKDRLEPTVELRAMTIDGPVAVPPRVTKFFGSWPPTLEREQLAEKLLPLAARAYRRPLTDVESDKLLGAALSHGEKMGQPEFGWHYAIRRILCSPEFLYRESTDSPLLSQHELASRLSYFLWSTMPDDRLLKLATAGKLSDQNTLIAETRRLLADPRASRFVKHFTGQWLGNRTVAAINVCDNRYPWDDNVRYGFVRSTEMFFDEVLRKNLPIVTFIDSDFTYANSAMQVVWGMKPSRDKNLGAVAARQRQSLVWPEPVRIDLKKTTANLPMHVRNRGGVLGLPGVLTVTGDGVESSPILRGVWVLENLFGQHPPPPPKDVPALDIDTSQAKTVRETLAAHQKIDSCAKCHRDIDPLGLVLENFDAVGSWREKYAGQKAAIDATATMPDGTKLNGADSIRKVILDQPQVFTRCLLTKILQYATGRELSVGDQRVVDELVSQEPEEGYRFQDLIEAAVTSKVFLAR